MIKISNKEFKVTLNQGLISALIVFNIAILGIAELFSERGLIAGLFPWNTLSSDLTLGQAAIFLLPIVFSFLAAQKHEGEDMGALLKGAMIGLVTALPLAALVWIESTFNIRQFFSNISPSLTHFLTFSQESLIVGSLILIISMTILCILAAGVFLLPEKIKKPLLSALLGLMLVGMFSEILKGRVLALGTTLFSVTTGREITRLIFSSKALQPVAAVIIFLLFYGGSLFRTSQVAKGKKPPTSYLSFGKDNPYRIATFVITAVTLLLLPLLLGSYLSEVANNIGLYILMGLGLNIVVGYAGLLDLGYVAFFAIGAYITGLLTTTGELGIFQWPFWVALPISVIIAGLAGIALGTPVLKMRGDYLAIVTLGFGEIIRILAGSDLLKGWIGGAQGIIKIPKPALFEFSLNRPQFIYYVILAGAALAWFVSVRLDNSRLGRQWMALREDEDVAEAMGINLVNTKLLAFAIGAAFSGLSGSIFAAKLTSIYPYSFNLLISINVLALIIVGGVGSLPGVVVGSIILIGLPELLREFQEYRLFMYGILLIVMMLARPEGFVPAAVFRRSKEAETEVLAAGD